MATTTIRIAMLNAEIPVPNVLSQRGTFGNIFHALLSQAASRISPNTTIISTDYDVREGQYPLSLSDVDVILITGSASSAYDNLEWIHQLDDYVYDVYTNYPHIKMFGSCFGHQLICQSLLREFGVVVEKDPNGWEVGVKEVELTSDFSHALKSYTSRSTCKTLEKIPKSLRLQMVHADHVNIPSDHTVPGSWMIIGDTKHCKVQGTYQPSRILTFQGHFEFDRFINSETMKVFGATWDRNVLGELLNAIDADDDSVLAAELVLRFLLETSPAKGTATRAVVGGLLTPPLQE